VHGEADQAVPVMSSRTYARAATKAGDDVELLELEGVGHFELIDPLSDAWPTVLAAVRRCASA
jgi:pimeloyl-ACP methyl ester carboxylesterase